MEGMPGMESRGPRLSLGAQAIGLWTRVDPAYGGRTFSEGYLTQPALMAHGSALGGRLALAATLNLEGLTLRRGELDPGIYGEGYVDRRHPHTYVHEVVLAAVDLLGRRDGAGVLSLSAGRGFVPFGTDDPMSRPLVKYPVNHHLAQVLERQVVIAGYRRGPVLVEAALFNGDEPIGPGEAPEWGRFGDSRAARATIFLPRGIEVQGSHAFVASPEFAAGAGPDQRKWSASVRYAGGPRYALVEWARSSEVDAGHTTFSFSSVLAEGSLDRGPWRLALRGERTVRPEEERLLDPFRSERPHTDFNVVGTTRWELATAGISREMGFGRLRARPFAEATRARATAATLPAVFIPADFYGSSVLWSLSLGLKLEAGTPHPRMGRYGAAAAGTTDHHHAACAECGNHTHEVH
jgi:hypothetical protein